MEANLLKGNASNFDMEKFSEVLGLTLQECDLEDGGGTFTSDFGVKEDAAPGSKPTKPKIREVSGDNNVLASEDDGEIDEDDEMDSPWETVSRGLKKRTYQCSPLEEPDLIVGATGLVHFRATIVEAGGSEVLLDDTHILHGGPLEFLITEFPTWPTLLVMLREMRVQEVSHFIVEAFNMDGYIELMSWWRRKAASRRPHWMATHKDADKFPKLLDSPPENSSGYADLDKLKSNKHPVRFEMDFCALDPPHDTEREYLEAKTLSAREAVVPKLRERGVELYKLGRLDMALDRFEVAVSFCEDLLEEETPTGSRFKEFQAMLLPILLNCSQCALNRAEFERADSYCSVALDIDPANTKALFRRGRARIGHWEPEGARADLQRVVEIDPSLSRVVAKEIAILDERELQASEQTAKYLEEIQRTGTLEIPAELKKFVQGQIEASSDMQADSDARLQESTEQAGAQPEARGDDVHTQPDIIDEGQFADAAT